MRKVFSKSIPNFPDDSAESHLASKTYPELFQLCKDTDAALFNRILIEEFSSPTIGPIYAQLIEGLTESRIIE
jgi:hypothetical protein